jgi:hypothetical protein
MALNNEQEALKIFQMVTEVMAEVEKVLGLPMARGNADKPDTRFCLDGCIGNEGQENKRHQRKKGAYP